MKFEKGIIWWIAVVFPFLANAHSLWLDPENYYPDPNSSVEVKVIFAHKFSVPDILLSRESLGKFGYRTPGGKEVQIKEYYERKQENGKGVLVGKFKCKENGTYVVFASLIRKGDEEHPPSQKFAKSIVIVGKGSGSVSTVFGDKIEIVPLKNPDEVKVGGDFPVKVLFEGNPLSTHVYAVYEGYTSSDKPFPIVTHTDENGIANIKIIQKGKWLITVSHSMEFIATLTFTIK